MASKLASLRDNTQYHLLGLLGSLGVRVNSCGGGEGSNAISKIVLLLVVALARRGFS